jgi:regulatory protein
MTADENFKSVLSKAMSLCATREYCTDDISNKLESWGIKSPDTEKILSILTAEKFLDDRRYAEAFVKDRYRHNKWGRIKIAAQLRIKRIPHDIIISAMETIEEDDYRQTLREILSSHKRFIKAKNQYDLKGKLMRYGLSKGFESNILYDLLNEGD